MVDRHVFDHLAIEPTWLRFALRPDQNISHDIIRDDTAVSESPRNPLEPREGCGLRGVDKRLGRAGVHGFEVTHYSSENGSKSSIDSCLGAAAALGLASPAAPSSGFGPIKWNRLATTSTD